MACCPVRRKLFGAATLLACLDRVLAIGICDSRALPGKSPRVSVMALLPAGVRLILSQCGVCVEWKRLPGWGSKGSRRTPNMG